MFQTLISKYYTFQANVAFYRRLFKQLPCRWPLKQSWRAPSALKFDNVTGFWILLNFIQCFKTHVANFSSKENIWTLIITCSNINLKPWHFFTKTNFLQYFLKQTFISGTSFQTATYSFISFYSPLYWLNISMILYQTWKCP